MTYEIENTNNSMMIIESLDINKVEKQMKAIKDFQTIVNQALEQGRDYGQAYFGSDKPSLLKPGAEKILMLMGLSSEYEIVDKIQNYEEGFFAYTIRCLLKKGNLLVTEGLGHCNSKERKYDGEKQDKFMLGNTCLKMAKKRAQVDATLTVGSLSNIFTQDIEDMIFETNEKTENMTIEEANNLVINFKKHRGKTLGEIKTTDRSYVEWISKNANDNYVKQAAILVLNNDVPSQEPSNEQTNFNNDEMPEFLKEDTNENLPF